MKMVLCSCEYLANIWLQQPVACRLLYLRVLPMQALRCMQVVPNPQLSVSPDRGHVAAESGAELELSLTPQQPGQVTATLELEVRGSKPLKLPIRCAYYAMWLHACSYCGQVKVAGQHLAWSTYSKSKFACTFVPAE
jgi:hypothetical protein